jgi:hypothetical protein
MHTRRNMCVVLSAGYMHINLAYSRLQKGLLDRRYPGDPKVSEDIVGLVARLTAGAMLVPALTAQDPTLEHWVRYSKR